MKSTSHLVFCRIKPSNENVETCPIKYNSTVISLNCPFYKGPVEFKLNKVFGQDSSQEFVYSSL